MLELSLHGIPWKLKRYLKTCHIIKGLDPEEAARRLQEYGKNILPARKTPGIVEITLHQF
jgi:hypothetical protein